MTSTLRQLTEEYEARARAAQAIPLRAVVLEVKRKATRTYTGQALARRQSWGRSWGAIVRERAKELQ